MGRGFGSRNDFAQSGGIGGEGNLENSAGIQPARELKSLYRVGNDLDFNDHF